MNPGLKLRETCLPAMYPVARILLPTGGLLLRVSRLEVEHTAPDFDIAVCKLDQPAKIVPHMHTADGRDLFDEPLSGAGADIDTKLAWLRAVIAGAECYANMAYSAHGLAAAGPGVD